MLKEIQESLELLRKKKPLVLCLSNYVSMEFVANCLLALGASPLMSEDANEIAELVQIAGAVNINIGTLDTHFIEKAQIACVSARSSDRPIILDPVGAGASNSRTETSKKFLGFANIIRGNASEILSLHNARNKTLGVDTINEVNEAVDAAKHLASSNNSVVIVSGQHDLIASPQKESYVEFGSSTMQLVTGMGCALTAVVAAFRAVIPDSFKAALFATSYFTLCGQTSAETLPGSFRTRFLDNINQPNWSEMKEIYDQRNINYR